jgi:hypothetical protein
VVSSVTSSVILILVLLVIWVFNMALPTGNTWYPDVRDWNSQGNVTTGEKSGVDSKEAQDPSLEDAYQQAASSASIRESNTREGAVAARLNNENIPQGENALTSIVKDVGLVKQGYGLAKEATALGSTVSDYISGVGGADAIAVKGADLITNPQTGALEIAKNYSGNAPGALNYGDIVPDTFSSSAPEAAATMGEVVGEAVPIVGEVAGIVSGLGKVAGMLAPKDAGASNALNITSTAMSHPFSAEQSWIDANPQMEGGTGTFLKGLFRVGGDFLGGLFDDIGTWLCTEIHKEEGTPEEDRALLRKFMTYAMNEHPKVAKGYLHYGNDLVKAINKKEEKHIFYPKLREEMLTPVLVLLRENKFEEAYIIYKDTTNKLMEKYTPELGTLKEE